MSGPGGFQAPAPAPQRSERASAAASGAAAEIAATLRMLGIEVFERGWLSSNNILFVPPAPRESATVVDTGYATHAEQTVSLLRHRLGERPLDRIVNTHLHSDHCGGNAALQREFGSEAWVPASSVQAVREWDAERLTYRATDQTCERFAVAGGLHTGGEVWLGDRAWQAWSTPGHDPEALVFFEPSSRVLIAGDALWSDRLAIVFPELAGADGFGGVRETLAAIESLRPSIVIPGHGAPFVDVAAALASSRRRLEAFEREPEKHFGYALRALAMFRMLEFRRLERAEFRRWLTMAPILEGAWAVLGYDAARADAVITSCIERLVGDGQLRAEGDWLLAAEN